MLVKTWYQAVEEKPNELLLGVCGHDPHQSSPPPTPLEATPTSEETRLTVMQFLLSPLALILAACTAGHNSQLHTTRSSYNFYVYRPTDAMDPR